MPLKSPKENGYDVIMASEMLGFLTPLKVDSTQHEAINLLSDDHFWQRCKEAITRSLSCFSNAGIELSIKDYLFTILFANPESPYTILNDGCCGDGGIPGYIFAWLTPSEYTMTQLPVALAHEAHHNIRFQFERWRDNITLGEMMVNEGLAGVIRTYAYVQTKKVTEHCYFSHLYRSLCSYEYIPLQQST